MSKGWKEPRNILVSRLRFTGDVILSTPLLDALACRFPGAAIDYLCEEPHDQVLWEHPRIRRILTMSPGSGTRETLAMARSLRGRYDWVLDLFGNPRSALLTALSGAKLRAAIAPMPRALAYNHRPEIPEGLAAPTHYLAILESLTGTMERNAPKVHLSGNERETGARLLADRGVGPTSIAILVGASQATKEWPLESYARLAALLKMGGRFEPVFLGQPGKRKALDRIRQLSHSQVVILPELPLRELSGVLVNMRALVAPDGGVLHLAIALGLPTLGLFGPTDPSIWFPYEGLPHAELVIRDAHCRPCHLHECPDPFCLQTISPEHVAERLARLLERT